MHNIAILQMIGYGDRTRTQTEVVRLFQEKISRVAADILRYNAPEHSEHPMFCGIDKRKAWILKLRIGKPVSKFMRVCSLHFAEEDF
ncbi:hypothetical protein NQ318_014358 [Aromia moschata]|uniref:THAP-type domain-containing protein n=1 Tax=Aromia moschata TaxID=1265417 RepID=A0AAV8YYR0_9CUCU|nr:hypothetical protein NQ318_014358 [Aromia moschata]